MTEPASAGAAADGEFVLLGMPDLQGAIRGKALRPDAFAAALREDTVMTDLLLALDPLDEPITDYRDFGLRAGAGDLVVRPEPDTLCDLRWRPGWRLCLGTPRWRDGRPCELAPREAARRALARMASLGFETLSAFEYEVRVRDAEGRPLSEGISYSVGQVGRFETLIAALVPALAGLGVELTAVHTEAGPGLLEFNLAARRGLLAADQAALTKLAVKEVAAGLGLHASFLAKTVPGEEGSSGHVHLSLWRDGANALAGPSQDELSPVCAGAVGGMLEHLGAASLALNPTINSYKRLVPGWFAPVNASWGFDNRSAALRVITSDRAELCRIECRRPGADANPYLALAVLVGAAADGIERGLAAPAPVTGDAGDRDDLPALPASLEAALGAWRADETLRRALGADFCDYYATSRAWELRAWQQAVSDWERVRYEGAV